MKQLYYNIYNVVFTFVVVVRNSPCENLVPPASFWMDAATTPNFNIVQVGGFGSGSGHYVITYTGSRTFNGPGEVMVQLTSSIVRNFPNPTIINYAIGASGANTIDVIIHDFTGNPVDERWSFVLFGAQ